MYLQAHLLIIPCVLHVSSKYPSYLLNIKINFKKTYTVFRGGNSPKEMRCPNTDNCIRYFKYIFICVLRFSKLKRREKESQATGEQNLIICNCLFKIVFQAFP